MVSGLTKGRVAISGTLKTQKPAAIAITRTIAVVPKTTKKVTYTS